MANFFLSKCLSALELLGRLVSGLILCRINGHMWDVVEVETCPYDRNYNDVVYECYACGAMKAEHVEKVNHTGKCHGCDADIGMHSLAGVTVTQGTMEFCSEACLDEWMDKVDKAQGRL